MSISPKGKPSSAGNIQKAGQIPFPVGHFALILNVAYGGWGGSCGMDDSAFPCEMKVDWIRYYKLKE